jgi:predicted permease
MYTAQSTVTQKVLIYLLLIGVGYLIKRLGLVTREDGRILSFPGKWITGIID